MERILVAVGVPWDIQPTVVCQLKRLPLCGDDRIQWIRAACGFADISELTPIGRRVLEDDKID